MNGKNINHLEILNSAVVQLMQLDEKKAHHLQGIIDYSYSGTELLLRSTSYLLSLRKTQNLGLSLVALINELESYCNSTGLKVI